MWTIRTFSSDSSRDIAMATDFIAKFGYMRSFGRAAFENGFQLRHSDSTIFNDNILATFSAKMMKISPVTPEITRVTNKPFSMRRQKSAYLTKYLTNYWTDLHQRFSFGRRMYGDYKTYISFAKSKGRCYANQLILGAFCRRQNWPSSLFALAFRNGMNHRLVHTRINS